jgi:D-alanine-D-alanine ligase
VTIDAIAAALHELGHEPVKLGNGRKLIERLLADPPDFVFNMAEGQGVSRSREARVPALLEMLGIPFTGSDPLTLAATLDKECAKKLVAASGVAVPRGFVITPDNPQCDWEIPEAYPSLDPPVIVKPAWEGSSKGIRGTCLIDDVDDIRAVAGRVAADYDQPVLVEEFISGDELTVGILGNKPPRVFGVMRVMPRAPSDRFVYSVEVKRDFRRQVVYQCPPDLPEGTLAAVEQAALRCYQALGCRDVARIDFRLRQGVPYFLEANPLPGLNPQSSDLVIMAGLLGWDYTKLIHSILRSARERYGIAAPDLALTI